MMKSLLKILICLIIGEAISSCDKEHIKDYYIQNDLNSSLIVNFKIDGVTNSMVIDTSKKELIYSHLYYYGTVGVDDDRDEDIISEIVIQVDTITRELDESLWQYEEIGKYHANYLMQID